MKQKTPEQLRKLITTDVVRITGCEKDSKEYDLGCVMLAASQVGVNVRRIAALLDRPEPEVTRLVKRLRKTGIFTRTRIKASDWFGKDGGMGFCLDIAVAEGYLKRVEGQ